MIFCKELNESFTDKKQLFDALMKHKEEIISLKKSIIKTSDAAAYMIKSRVAKKEAGASETLAIGDIVSNVINTTLYLDSHGDVHLDGIWNKSAKEQNGKTYHVVDHNLKIGSIVAYPKDVEIEVRRMKWKELGFDVDGETEALIYHSKMTDKTNPDVFKAYRDNEPVQHSIRMRYVNIQLAINDPEYTKAYEVFNLVLPKIVNKEIAEDQGYFWAVSEAKIEKEGSTVLFGSNDITPNLGRKETVTGPQSSTLPNIDELKQVFSQFKFSQ